MLYKKKTERQIGFYSTFEEQLSHGHPLYVLEAKLSGSSQKVKGIDGLLDQAIGNLSRLDKLYEEGTIAQKRQIIGSIYPEKLVFDGFQYRTARLNEAELIFTLDKGFSEIKNRKDKDFLCLSGLVPQTGIEPYIAKL